MRNLIFLLLSLFVLYSCKQNTAEEYYELGNSKCKVFDFQEAIKNYTSAIEINPKFAEAYYMRANAYLQKNNSDVLLANESDKLSVKNNGDREKSYADLNSAIELNPKFIDAYTSRAALKLENGLNVEAFEDYNKLIELGPNKAEYYSLRAKLKYNLNDFRSAIDDYKRAAIINPKSNWYYIEIGFIYGTVLNNPVFSRKEQIANYEKAYAIDTTDAWILVDIADARTQMKDHKGAVVYYTKYLGSKFINERIYKRTDVLIARGKARIFANLIDSGLADFSKAGELGNKEAYTAIAEYEGEKGRIEFERKQKDPNDKSIGLSDRYLAPSTENWLGKH